MDLYGDYRYYGCQQSQLYFPGVFSSLHIMYWNFDLCVWVEGGVVVVLVKGRVKVLGEIMSFIQLNVVMGEIVFIEK